MITRKYLETYCWLPSGVLYFTESNLPAGCHILTAGLWLSGTVQNDCKLIDVHYPQGYPNSSALRIRLATIREIYGLVNIAQTQLTEVDMPVLRRIVNFDYGTFYFYR